MLILCSGESSFKNQPTTFWKLLYLKSSSWIPGYLRYTDQKSTDDCPTLFLLKEILNWKPSSAAACAKFGNRALGRSQSQQTVLHLTSSCINYCFPPSSEKERSKQTNRQDYSSIPPLSSHTSPKLCTKPPRNAIHVCPHNDACFPPGAIRELSRPGVSQDHMGKSSSGILLSQGSLSGHQKHETQLSAGAMSQPMPKKHTGQCQQQLGLNFVPQVLFQSFELRTERRIKVTTELLSLFPQKDQATFSENYNINTLSTRHGPRNCMQLCSYRRAGCIPQLLCREEGMGRCCNPNAPTP